MFSVVKGGTGLCRVFCRTGRLLICLGKGREEGKWMSEGRELGRKKNAGTRGRRDGRSIHRGKEKEVGGTDGGQDSREV